MAADEACNVSSLAFDNLSDTFDRTSVPCPLLYYIISPMSFVSLFLPYVTYNSCYVYLVSLPTLPMSIPCAHLSPLCSYTPIRTFILSHLPMFPTMSHLCSLLYLPSCVPSMSPMSTHTHLYLSMCPYVLSMFQLYFSYVSSMSLYPPCFPFAPPMSLLMCLPVPHIQCVPLVCPSPPQSKWHKIPLQFCYAPSPNRWNIWHLKTKK